MKKIKLSIFCMMSMLGIVLIGSETGDWPSQLFVSTGGMVMFLIGIYFCTETLKENK